MILVLIAIVAFVIYAMWCASSYILLVGIVCCVVALMISSTNPMENLPNAKIHRQLDQNTSISVVYVLAWHYYCELEPLVPRAWLFQKEPFLERLKRHCVLRAVQEWMFIMMLWAKKWRPIFLLSKVKSSWLRVLWCKTGFTPIDRKDTWRCKKIYRLKVTNHTQIIAF